MAAPERKQGSTAATEHREVPSTGLFPRDLLPLLLSFIDFQPRMKVLSLVCKKWRVAVLQSVTTYRVPRYIAGSSSEAHARATLKTIPLFPSLRSLSLNTQLRTSPPLSLPTTLTRFDVGIYAKFMCAPPLPALAHLSMGVWRFDTKPLVMASVSSLTYLSLPWSAFPESNTEPLHFPALRHLKLHTPGPWASYSVYMSHIVQRHASQLDSLSLFCFDIPDAIIERCSASFPRLRSLRVSGLTGQTRVVRLLSAAPILESLALDSVPLSQIPLTYHSVLTELAIATDGDEKELAAVLPTLPKLKSLYSSALLQREFPSQLLCSIAGHLFTVLSLSPASSKASLELALRVCTNITSLTLCSAEPTCTIAGKLPYLAKLTAFPKADQSNSDFFAFVLKIAANAPVLTAVVLRMLSVRSKESRDELVNFAKLLFRQSTLSKLKVVLEGSTSNLSALAAEIRALGNGWPWVRFPVPSLE